MSIQYLDLYDQGRLRHYEHWRIYALFCMRTPTEAVVKIGCSSIVYDRMVALQAGLPFRIGVVLHAPCGDRDKTMLLESRLHRAFKNRNTRGEWFEFNMGDPEAKDEFHSVTKAIYLAHTGKPLVWDKITQAQISAFATLQKKNRRQAVDNAQNRAKNR